MKTTLPDLHTSQHTPNLHHEPDLVGSLWYAYNDFINQGIPPVIIGRESAGMNGGSHHGRGI